MQRLDHARPPGAPARTLGVAGPRGSFRPGAVRRGAVAGRVAFAWMAAVTPPVLWSPSALGCGASGIVELSGTERAEAVVGQLQVEEIEGGQQLVTVALAHLAPPRRLGPNLSTYVVWLQGESRAAENVGALSYDEERREGRLMTPTPHRSFALWVTAEADARVTRPGDAIIVSQGLRSN